VMKVEFVAHAVQVLRRLETVCKSGEMIDMQDLYFRFVFLCVCEGMCGVV